MAQNTQTLSRIMRMSWDIQKTKFKTRQNALRVAWAIYNNEDITVQYLMRKLNRNKPVKQATAGQFVLFTNETATNF